MAVCGTKISPCLSALCLAHRKLSNQSTFVESMRKLGSIIKRYSILLRFTLGCLTSHLQYLIYLDRYIFSPGGQCTFYKSQLSVRK